MRAALLCRRCAALCCSLFSLLRQPAPCSSDATLAGCPVHTATAATGCATCRKELKELEAKGADAKIIAEVRAPAEGQLRQRKSAGSAHNMQGSTVNEASTVSTVAHSGAVKNSGAHKRTWVYREYHKATQSPVERSQSVDPGQSESLAHRGYHTSTAQLLVPSSS